MLHKRLFIPSPLPSPSPWCVCVQSYYDAMTDEDSESLPLRLRGKRDVIFGNLPEIYKFHERQDRYHTLGVLAHGLFVGLESHGTL